MCLAWPLTSATPLLPPLTSTDLCCLTNCHKRTHAVSGLTSTSDQEAQKYLYDVSGLASTEAAKAGYEHISVRSKQPLVSRHLFRVRA